MIDNNKQLQLSCLSCALLEAETSPARQVLNLMEISSSPAAATAAAKL